MQVNGGGDVLFNDDPTPEGIPAIVSAHRRFGTTGLLPTLISDLPEKTSGAIRAADEPRPASRACSAFISRDRSCRPSAPGVHDPRHVPRRPDDDDLALITAKRRGVTL